MKLQFTPMEMQYLNAMLAVLNIMNLNNRMQPDLVRKIAKMKYKFSPNATLVSLGRKERTFLAEVLSYRQRELIKANQNTTEVDILQTTIEKLEVR